MKKFEGRTAYVLWDPTKWMPGVAPHVETVKTLLEPLCHVSCIKEDTERIHRESRCAAAHGKCLERLQNTDLVVAVCGGESTLFGLLVAQRIVLQKPILVLAHDALADITSPFSLLEPSAYQAFVRYANPEDVSARIERVLGVLDDAAVSLFVQQEGAVDPTEDAARVTTDSVAA